jgi:preprotein translocase subunit SecE
MSEPSKNPIVNYFQESYDELKKVTWPTRNQAIRLTLIVIGFCIVLSVLVGVLDFAFNTGYRYLVIYAERISPAVATPITAPQNVQTTPVSNIISAEALPKSVQPAKNSTSTTTSKSK